MRLHLVGLPHTQTIRAHTVCAFTQKITKFGEMMEPFDYELIVYSGEHNETPCTEHVALFTDEEQLRWYGTLDQNTLPAVAKFDANEEPWAMMNVRAIREIQKRAEPRDVLLLLAGLAQKPISDAFPGLISCEWAAGYSGIFLPYVCFESYAWMHHLYGRNGIHDGRWFDTVIPNFFRPDDFSLGEGDGEYLLFVGRLISRKGLNAAFDVSQASGLPLWLAGSGAAEWRDGYLRTEDGTVLEGDVRYLGPVQAKERNELMGNATALLCPTTYIEPFGAVAVEAQLCGTPAIATDFGAFTETVSREFRFRTLAEGVAAVERARDLDAQDRKWLRVDALRRYSLEAIGPEYDRWFRNLQTLWDRGWYEVADVVS